MLFTNRLARKKSSQDNYANQSSATVHRKVFMKIAFSNLRAVFLVAGFALCATPFPTQAQDPNNGSAPDSKPAPATPAGAEKKKPKKVWTNDEIGSVGGQISVVGTQDQPKTEKPAAKKVSDASADSDAHQKQVDRYKEQMKQFQAQIDATDKQIDKLKNFKAENSAPSGGIAPTQAYSMTPPEDQVKQLEDKKKQLQAKMDDTEQEARRNGVSRDELR